MLSCVCAADLEWVCSGDADFAGRVVCLAGEDELVGLGGVFFECLCKDAGLDVAVVACVGVVLARAHTHA